VNASERIAIGDPVSRRFTLTATGHLNDSEVIQELTTCVVLYVDASSISRSVHLFSGLILVTDRRTDRQTTLHVQQ